MSNNIKQDLVSVVMPTHNSMPYVIEAIQSVLDQTYSNIEIIVVDDCSIDKTKQFIKDLQQRDTRVKFYKLRKQSGPAHARNIGIKKAQGRYIAFLDSDDRWRAEKLMHQIDFMTKSQVAFSYTAYDLIDQDSQPLQTKYDIPEQVSRKQLLYENKLVCSTVIYDAEHIGKAYFPELIKRQDYALWLRLLNKIPCAYGLKICLADYRQTPNSVSSKKLSLIKYNWKVFHEIEKLPMYLSFFYLCANILNKIKKVLILRIVKSSG